LASQALRILTNLYNHFKRRRTTDLNAPTKH
jgi:hypothetical protein